LLVKRVTGSETLCGGLEYRLLCVPTDAHLPLKKFIALPIELQFVTDRGDHVPMNGDSHGSYLRLLHTPNE
jgi:type VI secretion system secreted protein VgrG